MKKINFLKNLFRKKKLEEVESSQAIKDSYLEKSESNLISAKILLDSNRLEESVSLAYYSMYHMITALFFLVGIKCENHTASIMLFKDIFDLDNREISFAKSERVDKQYYTNFYIKREDVVETIAKAEDFRRFLFDFISSLNAERMSNYRNKFKVLLSSLF